MTVMDLTRLDLDTNTSYPWHTPISGGFGNIQLAGILPVGAQQWVVVHQVWDGATSSWIVATRVTGSWTSGDPHSTLTVSASHYASMPAVPGTTAAYINTGRVTDFYPTGGTGPAHVTFMTATGQGIKQLDVKWHYCTFDLDTGTLTTVTSGHKTPSDFTTAGYDLGFIPSNILACDAYNAHNKAIAVIFTPDADYFEVGVLQPDTGLLSPPVQVQSSIVRGDFGTYSPFNDIMGYLVGGQDLTTGFPWRTYMTDYSYYPPVVVYQVVPLAYWNNNPAKNQVAWSADTSYFASDVPGSGGVVSPNPRTPFPFVSCYFGHAIGQGVTTSTKDNTWLINYPLTQRMPVAGWPNGTGYIPHPVSDWPNYTQFTTKWLGHVSSSDPSPVYSNTFTYPPAPFFRYTPRTATQPWDIGGLTLGPPPTVDSLTIVAANFDTNAGRSPAGTVPPYAPALWVFGTSYGGLSPDYPLNLWAGAVA